MTTREFAAEAHASVNHLYDGKPYVQHLIFTVSVAKAFIHLIPEAWREVVIDACWCHDLIEDTRLSYADVGKKIGIAGANIVFAVSHEKGKTRAERANAKYYEGIRNTPYATFVKLCDRMANIIYSSHMKSSMLNVYKAEHKQFVTELFKEEYKEIFQKMEEALEGTYNAN